MVNGTKMKWELHHQQKQQHVGALTVTSTNIWTQGQNKVQSGAAFVQYTGTASAQISAEFMQLWGKNGMH